MKKMMATMALSLTFAAVAGTAAHKDMPIPSCFPCAASSVVATPKLDMPIPSCFPCDPAPGVK